MDAGDEVWQVHGRELYLWLPAGIAESAVNKQLMRGVLGVTWTARNWSTVLAAGGALALGAGGVLAQGCGDATVLLGRQRAAGPAWMRPRTAPTANHTTKAITGRART
ncbi:MAG: hypothetical protein U0S36_12215 [Candidatus Nanopelagicales bacterium]